MNKKTFKSIRALLGFTQEALGKRLGRHHVTINRYENGKEPIPLLVGEKMLELKKSKESVM